MVGLGVALECGVHSRILLTDQLEMLDLMKHNIKLNDVQDRASAMILNWYVSRHPSSAKTFFLWTNRKTRGEPLPDIVVEQRPNVIIAAECVYFEPAFPLLMQTLKDLLELNSAAVVYFCFKKRRRADMSFVKKAKKAFLVEELFDEDRPVFQRSGLFLFSFRHKQAALKVNGAVIHLKSDKTELLPDNDSGIYMT